MFISLSSTCIQNFSNWHVLFVFLSHSVYSRWGMNWDTACRPKNDPFWAFLSHGAQDPVQPPNKICVVSLGSWKKYILGIQPKKVIIPAPFHSKAFVLLYKFETSLALIGRLSRSFFAIPGASNFKHFKQLFMTLLFGFLTMWDWVSLSSLLFCI